MGHLQKGKAKREQRTLGRQPSGAAGSLPVPDQRPHIPQRTERDNEHNQAE